MPAADAPMHKRRAAPATIKRETFATSRRLEFLPLPELEKQSGYSRDRWPEVIVKELVDNALDACEESGVAHDGTLARSRPEDCGTSWP